MNTRVSYLYRDASNYKRFNEQVLEGTLTSEEINDIVGTLYDREWFIPAQVGLPEDRFEKFDEEDDHSWFELYKEDFEQTEDAPTIALTAKALYNNFMQLNGKWDDVNRYLELSGNMEKIPYVG